MNQNFSSQQLLKLCHKHEWEDYGITREELVFEIDSCFECISNGSFIFSLEREGDFFLSKNLAHKLILRKLNDNIKRIYKDEQGNRRIIIKQVKTLLEENIPMWILKTDIESFYESVNRSKVVAKLKNDTMLSYHSIWLIENLFATPILKDSIGLPRGMSISSTLSEIFMRRFDRWIQRMPSVYYYARFVDDIIVFSNNKSEIQIIKDQINNNLEEGLHKKESKTILFDGNNITDIKALEYLGYKFTTSRVKNKKKVNVSIAKKKIKKIKTRITLAVVDYTQNKDFNLLNLRMSFLTGNYSIKKNNDGQDLKAGIFYNYCHITDYKDLHELNLYYRKLLYCKAHSLGKSINSKLTTLQRNKLMKYSFTYGHQNKVYNSFSLEQMIRIKRCWQ